jgi:NosR/NirI family nitrous oxide reductase transcriptional regulator
MIAPIPQTAQTMRHWLFLKLPVVTGAVLLGLLISANVLAREHPLDQVGLEQARTIFPEAQALAASEEDPLTRAVYGRTELLGYLFFSDDLVPMPAYSGRPIRNLIGLNMDASIQGVIIVEHEEPILIIGITDNDLSAFIAQYHGLKADARVRIGAHNRKGYLGVDGITGATITAIVLNSSVMKSAKMAAEARGLPRPAEAAPVAAPVVTAPAEPQATPPAELEPLWVELWKAQSGQLVILLTALLLLMGILFFQDWLVVHTTLFKRVRIGYLLFTVFYLGFYSKAQLSVINLLAFLRVLFGGFTWDTLLIDPMIFILWGFVAVSIIFWGRGVFCGWLCPFGALQELIHKVAERLPLTNFEFPPMVHERLWAIKYFILIALVGLSLESMVYAARLAEVEPFKTTFVMRFDRELWFVAYAWLLLLIAIFNSKFYCKYLCPLGAALSFFTRFRIFDWLRRRPDCGSPCQSCAAQCQISAIKPSGEIIDNECHYCLECQVSYWDDHKCPPLVEKRKKREAREARAQGVIASDSTPR